MATYYVRTTGNDSTGTGATGAPWKTIQYALTHASALGGDTIKVGSGTYTEHLMFNTAGYTVNSGVNGSPNVLEAEDSANKPIIKATTTHAMRIRNLNYWTFNNLKITGVGGGINCDASTANISNLIFDGLEIFGLQCLQGNVVDNSHPLIFVSTSSVTGVSWCTVQNCIFENCITGLAGEYNEVSTCAGNVSYIKYLNSTIRNCTYIGFDLIGQGPYGFPTYPGLHPNHIIYQGNEVNGLVRPAGESTAVAYKNDGGQYVLWQDNYAAGCTGFDIGMEPWFDTGVTLSTFICRNNIVNAYSADRDVLATQVGSGGNGMGPNYESILDKIAVYHNVLIAGTTANASIWGRGTNVKYKNNFLGSQPTEFPDYHGASPYAAFTTGNECNGNCYWGGVGWRWFGNTTRYSTLADFQSATSQEANGQVGTPSFSTNWTIDSSSPGYNEAIHLTTANGAGTSETELVVASGTGWMFSDGWGMIGGDIIEIEQSGGGYVERTISSVTGDTLTLSSAATWLTGAKIYVRDAFSVGLTSPISSGETPNGPGGNDGGNTPVDSGTEVTVNGDFADGSAGWSTYSRGSTTFAFTGGKAEIDCTTDGGNTQLYQYGLPVTNGNQYTIRLTANSNSGSAVNVLVVLHLQNDPWTALGFSQTVTIPTSESTQDFTFYATGGTINARLRMAIYSGADISVNEFSLLTGTGEAPGAGTTDSVTLSSTDDYYHENLGGFGNDSNPSFVGDWRSTPYANYDYATGWIFVLTSDIPDGATIDNCTLKMTSAGFDNAIAPMTVAFENATDPAKPTTKADATGRTYTTGVSWSPGAWVSGTEYTSPNLAVDMQSLLDTQAGLTNGDNVHIRVIDAGTGFDSYRLNYIGTAAAELVIAWSTASGGGSTTGGGLTVINAGLRTGLRSSF